MRQPDREETDLVRRARSGDYEAFERLVSRHERRIYALAMRLVRQRHDAEDVVQTTFLSALEHIGQFREEASFSAWVTRIAVNAALKLLRKRKGLPTVSLEVAGDVEGEGLVPRPQYVAHWRDTPARLLERAETRRELEAALAELDGGHRVVFVLRDVEGLSVRETAEVLGLTEANVKVRLLRARLRLRERLTRAFGDETTRVPVSHRSLRGGPAGRGAREDV